MSQGLMAMNISRRANMFSKDKIAQRRVHQDQGNKRDVASSVLVCQ